MKNDVYMCTSDCGGNKTPTNQFSVEPRVLLTVDILLDQPTREPAKSGSGDDK